MDLTQSLRQDRSNLTIYICFFPIEKTFVKLNVMPGEKLVEADVGDEFFLLNINVHAFPQPEFIWKKGSLVISNNNQHYDIM